ncbi:hypothetical protein KUTeg_013011 [Tegillarca granosa]|uniref:Suppressor of forked domain-containing protein n=1 Tax=Tegillarca granosa TaxID=220873 RepID=A0ABQ9ESF9_TEGGR|nr:hypothetical protein KUTeg_013011 [Tegillarca granosa]
MPRIHSGKMSQQSSTEDENMKETNPDNPVDTQENKDEGQEDPVNTELEKYWKAVRETPSDFTGWTYLLQFVEQENKIEAAREAYDAFFSNYPYCYGYWKKYADMEKRHNNLDKATEIFERGLKAVPMSIDLWLHYINYYIGEYGKAEQGEGDIRSFKHHVYIHHPKEIMSLDDFFKLRKEVVAKTDAPEDDEDADAGLIINPPGEEVPPGMETEGGKSDEEEAMKIRDVIIQQRDSVFKQTEEEVSKRWNFEEGIKRPYFHVKPLERAQLKNWREYLDWEIQNGPHERVVILFERCMIATALYEDFWMKYAKYMEDHSIEAVRNVYRRACKIHLPKKPYIHMAWAAFEERQGNHEAAWEILANLEKSVPGLVMVSMRRISLERRQGNNEDADALFHDYIENAKKPEIGSFFSVKFARYLFKVVDDTEKARQVLHKAIEKDPGNLKLFLQLIDIEYQCKPIDEDRIIDLFSQVLASEDFPLGIKVKMSQRKLEFLEDFGHSILKLKEAYDEHQKLMKDLNGERKKRHNEPSHAHSHPAKIILVIITLITGVPIILIIIHHD